MSIEKRTAKLIILDKLQALVKVYLYVSCFDKMQMQFLNKLNYSIFLKSTRFRLKRKI